MFQSPARAGLSNSCAFFELKTFGDACVHPATFASVHKQKTHWPTENHSKKAAWCYHGHISNVTNNVTLKHCNCKWSHTAQFLKVFGTRCTDVCSKASCLFCCIIGFGILQSGALRSGIKKNQPRLLLLPEPNSMLPWTKPNH